MSSRKFTDTNRLKFLNENYEKEKWLRMQWVNLHTEDLQRATILNRERTNYTKSDIIQSVMSAEMAIIARDNVKGAANRKKLPMKDIDLVKLCENQEIIPVMKPVPEKHKKIFYTEQREVYLKKRNILAPDQKYHFIECENWKHGWEFDQSEFKLRGPVHGKRFHLSRMRGLGPQPDPPHYQDCKEMSDLCTDMN